MASVYDRLGGAPAVNAAVDAFYVKVLADDRVKHFFEGVDMRAQKQKQKGFLTFAFGGPNKYTGKSMRAGHKHLVARGLNDSHVDAIIELLGATLKELGVAADDIAEVAKIAESVRDDVLCRETQLQVRPKSLFERLASFIGSILAYAKSFFW